MIKYFIICFFLITQLFSAQPKWYLNLEKAPDTIYGYGKDIKPHNARILATKMIQKRINHKIIPKYLQFIRESKKDGITYVAYSYNNKSIFNKIYQQKESISTKTKPIHPLLEKSPFYREMVYRIKFKPNFNISKENKSWYIHIDQHKFYLDVLNFPKLFSNISNEKLTFKTNSRVFTYPDNIQFTIYSKEDGYISILYSSPYGEVKSILSNEPITTTQFNYPQEDKNKLTIYNEDDIAIKELYIAVFSKEPLDLFAFEFMNDKLLLDGSNYNFDKLLHILNNNRFSTIKVRIKPGKKQ